MTLIQRLAREAAPCTGRAANYEPCGVYSYARWHLCESCAMRPEIEAKMLELGKLCADLCDQFNGWRDVRAAYPTREICYTDAAWMADKLAEKIRDLLTADEAP